MEDEASDVAGPGRLYPCGSRVQPLVARGGTAGSGYGGNPAAWRAPSSSDAATSGPSSTSPSADRRRRVREDVDPERDRDQRHLRPSLGSASSMTTSRGSLDTRRAVGSTVTLHGEPRADARGVVRGARVVQDLLGLRIDVQHALELERDLAGDVRAALARGEPRPR
jgi:hypothetical protein